MSAIDVGAVNAPTIRPMLSKNSATRSARATIESSSCISLNQCCAPASYLESMLLTRASKTFFDSIDP
jgi:hypothetical protein